jgi:hypothetical protein
MAIYRANLLDAMPVDMPQEDREYIADELLKVSIEHGNKLRRKRLIDALMAVSDEMEQWDGRDKRSAPAAVARFGEWSALLSDAAMEIRSVL